MNYIYKLLCFGLIACLCSCNNASIATKDLDFMYQAIIDNHPGMYNELDPSFREQLDSAYQIAQKALRSANSENQEKQILRDFTRSFDDNHLFVAWKNEAGQAAQQRSLTTFAVTFPTPDSAWITVPTFNLNEKLLCDYEKVLAVLPNFRLFKAIVFDLRENDGGNSDHGTKILEALFGKEYTTYKLEQYYQNSYSDWRASEGNLAFIKALASQKTMAHSQDDGLVQGLQKCIAEKKPYFSKQEECDYQEAPSSYAVSAQIFVIIHQKNVSAALDFIDQIRALNPSTTLVGQETGSDRLYIDTRHDNLPSGRGKLFMPMKVWRNRVRGDKETYKPDLKIDVADTGKLQQFLIEYVEKR